jgi:hypothetical protein
MSAITIKDTKSTVYLTNIDKTTGEIESVIIPHDLAIGFTGVEKKLIITGGSLFYGDSRHEGNIYSRMFVNSANVKYDNTIYGGTNAMLVGPVTIDSDITVTIESGAVLKIL